ncbi:HAD family hydrolase [bacterium]|nr:HAD family hydrolase [bacterium]
MSLLFDNYIFDLDGTLINSSNEVLLCLKNAFKKSNYDIDETGLTSNLIGPPIKQIIQAIVPELKDEVKLSEIISNFRYFYDNEEDDISDIYPDVYQTLEHLKSFGKKLFIATFKPQKSTMRILRQFNMDYFEDVYTIDKFDRHITKEEMIKDIINKYNLDAKKTVMIGDAKTDMIAAKSAEITAVGALWGYGDDKQPLIDNADITIKGMKELWD